MGFNKIIGHKKIKENLINAYKKDHISHCYLFEGEESLGKKKIAMAFAKILLCKNQGTEPCNRCISCYKFDNFNHPDMHIIEPEDDLIKKQIIDELVRNMNVAPFESKRRVIIIDDCHKIRVEGQNGLLKTLEEPPPYINIILITSNRNAILPTIVSRCQIIKFHPIEDHYIKKLLIEEYKKTFEEASFIVGFAKGSVGRAINLAKSNDFLDKRDEIIRIIDRITSGDKLEIFNSMDFFIKNKKSYEEVLDIILFWFRDLGIYMQVGDSDLITNKDKVSTLSNSSHFNLMRISGIINRIEEVKQDISRNVNYQLAIETMLLEIAGG